MSDNKDSGTAAVQADDDNRYKALQQKLKALATAMDTSSNNLAMLQQRMRMNAQRAENLAVHIANADLDPKFVEMTQQVAVALGGAAFEVNKLSQMASEFAGLTHDTRRDHARLYEALDTLRSDRPERTPKPGFLVR